MTTETFAQALRAVRSARGLSLADLGRLVNFSRQYIWDLEHGRRQPHPDTAAALDRALDAEGRLVALAAADAVNAAVPRLPAWDDRMAAGVNGRCRPDPAMADYLASGLALHRAAEDTAGPGLVLLPVLGQFATAETLRADAYGDLHDRLLSIESQIAQFLGWLYQDLGDRAAAGQWYARALERAAEAGDQNMVASILSMRSNTAWGYGDHRRAAQLGEASTRVQGAAPGVLALAHQQAARGYAATGDRTAAQRALDKAVRLSRRAAADPEREPPWVYFLDETRMTIQRAICHREAGDYKRAIEMFRRAIDDLPPAFRRDRGQYLARLALALAKAGEREEAEARAIEARTLAEETGSARTAAELDRVDALLHR